MLSYKSLFKRLKLRGSGGGSPVSNKLVPPDRTNVKESYAVTRSQDLIAEGPIEGFADRDTRVLRGARSSDDTFDRRREASTVIKRFNDTTTTHESRSTAFALKGWGDKKLNKTYVQSTASPANHFKGTIDKIKILILLDQSGSFNDFSNPVANAMESFVAELRAGPYNNIEFAIFGFAASNTADNVILGYTSNYTLIASTISGAAYTGGTENGNTALIDGLSSFPGADEVILMTDEIGDDPQNEALATTAALGAGVRVHVTGYGTGGRGLSVNRNPTLASAYDNLATDTGGIRTQADTATESFSEIMDHILRNTRGLEIFETFAGARYAMSQDDDIFILIFDGTNWVISNSSKNKIYWTLPVSSRNQAHEILLASAASKTGWVQVSATSSTIGEIIDLKHYTIDKSVFFDETPCKTNETPNFATYKLGFRDGAENQAEENILGRNVKLISVEKDIKGPFVSGGSATKGSGNSDVRNGRDFATWQNYTPALREPLNMMYEITDSNVDKLDITIQIKKLNSTQSYSPASDSERGRATLGRLQPTAVKIKFRIKTLFIDGREETSIPTFTLGQVDGKGVSSSSGQIRIYGIVTAGYEFTVKDLILPEHTSDIVSRKIEVSKVQSETLSSILSRDVKIRSIAEKNKYTYNYPFSANLAISLDSRSTQSVPNRTYMIKGKKILVPSNYFPTDDYGGDRRFSVDGSSSGEVIYDGIWDGTFRFAWSDNPAWILYDLLINYRYGTAIFNRETDKINIWSLYEIGKYCDGVDSDGRFVGLPDGRGGLEPRFSFNHTLKEDRQAFDIIKDIAKSMRALAFYQNSQIQFRVDKPEEPVMLFNNLNARDGVFTYSDTYKSSRTTAIDVSFLDKENNYRPRSEHVEDEEAIQKFGYNRQTMQGFGITSRGQAIRAGRAVLFDSIHATETISFEVGLEGMFLQPGDMIRVDDELKNLTKNFGKFLGTSGFFYYNNGPGPKALLVDKNLKSVTGAMQTGQEITVYTPRGTTGVDDLYNLKDEIQVQPATESGFISDEEISGLKNPQISKFVLDTGDNYIEEFDDFLKFNLHTGHDYNSLGSNNFSQNSIVTVDITGRLERLYRVLNVEENEERFYEVGALIHHTGKYDFIEQGVSFDTNLDKFEPGIKANVVALPNKPSGVATGNAIQNTNFSIDMPIRVTGDPVNGGDEFALFLTQPNGNSNVGAISFDNTGDVVTFNLSDENGLELTQVGTYQVEVFSLDKNVGIQSSGSASLTFALSFDDFNFDAGVDSYLSYENIQLKSGYTHTFSGTSTLGVVTPSGSGFAAYDKVNADLAASFDIDLRDVYGDDAFASDEDYNITQTIDLISSDGTYVKSGFKTLGNEDVLEITTGELMSGFDYTGDKRFVSKPELKLELNQVQNINFESGILSGQFSAGFESTPVLFALNKFTGQSENTYDIMPPAVIDVSSTGFVFASHAKSGQDYKFIAVSTGLHPVSGNTMQVGFVNKSGTDFERVNYDQNFTSNHHVYIQSQSHGFPVQTYVTGVDTSGFSFNSMDSKHFNKSGLYGFLAVETGLFNVSSGGSPSINLLNYRNTGSGSQVSGFPFDSGINAFLNEALSDSHIANVENTFSIIQPSGGELGQTFSITTDSNESFIIKKDFTSKIFSGISGSGANQFIITPTAIGKETDEYRDIGTGDFSLLFANYQETELVNDFTIMSKINDSGFRLFTESGNIYLYMKDSLGISGQSMVFESVPTGIINKFALTVDRDIGCKSYINGKQNMFQTGLNNITGNISIPSTGLKALQSHNSNLVVTPDHAYSLYNLNGNPDQYVVDVVDLETENSGSFKASDLIDGTLLNFVGTSGLVAKLYDQFGGKNAYQNDTGLMPFIVANSQLINLDGTPSMVFRSGTRNAFLNIKTDGFTSNQPDDVSSFITGESGIEVFVQASFDNALRDTTKGASYRGDFIFGENFNNAKNDFGFGIGSGFGSSSDPRFYLYAERGSNNGFSGFGIDSDTDESIHGYGYSGELVTLGQKYVMNAFAGFDTVNESGVVGIRHSSNYTSGNVISGRNNYIVGTIGSDQTYDSTFQGKLQEILFYTGLQAQREDIYNSVVNRSTRRLDYLINPFGDQIFLDAIGYTRKILTNTDIISLQSGSQSAFAVDDGGIIINLSEGTGEIKDLSEFYLNGTTKFTNQISGISKTFTGATTGAYSGFSFFNVEGTDLSPSGLLTKIADAPQYNRTGVTEGDGYVAHDYISGAESDNNGILPKIGMSNKYMVIGYGDKSNPQGTVDIYNLETKTLTTGITGNMDVYINGGDEPNFGSAVAINDSGDLFIAHGAGHDGEPNDGGDLLGHIHYYRHVPESGDLFDFRQTITGTADLFDGTNLPVGTGSPSGRRLGGDIMKATNTHLIARYGSADNDRGHVGAFRITGSGDERALVPYGLLSRDDSVTGNLIVHGVTSGVFFDRRNVLQYGKAMAINDNFCLIGDQSDVENINDTGTDGNIQAQGLVDVWSLTGTIPERLYTFSNLEATGSQVSSSENAHISFAERDFEINDNNRCVFPSTSQSNGKRCYVYDIAATGQSFVTGLTGFAGIDDTFNGVTISNNFIFASMSGANDSTTRPSILVFEATNNFTFQYQIFSQGPEYGSTHYESKTLGELLHGQGQSQIASKDEGFFVAVNASPANTDNHQLHVYANTGGQAKIIS